MDTGHEDLYRFTIKPLWILLRTTNVSDKRYKKSKHTFYVPQHFPDNYAVYWIMWENMITARQATDGNIIQCRNDARIHKHTLRIRNTYCFSTATTVVPKLRYM